MQWNQGGTQDGAEGADNERDESEAVSRETGLPLSEKWAAFEDELRDIDEEMKREEDEAARTAEENKALIPLRMERLNKNLAAYADVLKSSEAAQRAMFSGGNARLWDVRQALTSRQRERDAADEQRMYAADVAEFGEEGAELRETEREEMMNAQAWRAQAPLWQQICGFTPEEELGVHPNVRAAAIRRLIKRAEWLIRWEIRHGRTEGNGEGANAGDGDAEDVLIDSSRRTTQWDPLREICLYLGIAQRKLSALCREVNGLAVTQLCDAIRAETLRKKMKKRLAEWLGTMKELTGGRGNLKDRAFELWRQLKSERQKTGSHRSSFAWEIGFSSYTRMFRACLVCYGLAPQELELLLIKESLGECAPCVFGQAGPDEVKKRAEAEGNSEKPAEAG